MNKAEEYRRHATDCLSMAALAIDSDQRISLLEMARAWFTLADQADRNSMLDLVYEPPPVKAKPQQSAVQQQQQIQPDKKSD